MDQRQVGSSGLLVSSLGLGTRTWGRDTEQPECIEMLDSYQAAGGNFLDVQAHPRYPEPLEAIGSLLSGTMKRDDIVLCLRSGRFNEPGQPVSPVGPSRAQLLGSFDKALVQLNTDYVDLWIAQGPRTGVPLQEALSALETVYCSGRARYVGLSGFSWWDGGVAAGISQTAGWKLSAWGSQVSLLSPLPLSPEVSALYEGGLGIIAGAPLAGGVLTGKYRHTTPPDSRATSPRFRGEIGQYLQPRFAGVLDAVSRAAEGLERSTAQVALAWARDLPGVASSVIGPRTNRQLTHLLEIAHWQIPKAINNVLAEVSVQLL